MYCPHCGQQQISDVTRFCSRCGFPLETVSTILATGGTWPARLSQTDFTQLSDRSKGVRQGALIMLSTILLVPLVTIIGVVILGIPGVIIPLTAITCFVGGLLRILYALLMEDPNRPMRLAQPVAFAPPTPQFDRPARQSALPSPPATTSSWRPNPTTAEIYQPPSVTENTTRLLDKEDKSR